MHSLEIKSRLLTLALTFTLTIALVDVDACTEAAIRCSGDATCPAALPVCSQAGVCEARASEGEGEGAASEGEGEGAHAGEGEGEGEGAQTGEGEGEGAQAGEGEGEGGEGEGAVGEGEGEGEGAVGEGEGEGAASCGSDVDCAPGLCVTPSDGLQFAGQCVPQGDDTCAAAGQFTSTARENGGPAIVGASLVFTDDGCGSTLRRATLQLYYFDREADVANNAIVELRSVGGDQGIVGWQTFFPGARSGNGTMDGCNSIPAPGVPIAVRLFDQPASGHGSNVICLTPSIQ